MPWVAKALLFALKTKRGREVLFAGALGAFEMARSPRARSFYAGAGRQGRRAARLARALTYSVKRG